MDPLEELLALTGAELIEPFAWPGPRLRSATETLCGWLDALPAVGRGEDGTWGVHTHGAWGCKMQLYRIWGTRPVIR
jgi:hypothetical protein